MAQLKDRFGDIGEQRLTLMAAITLADLQDAAEAKLARREAELALAIDAIADRLEAAAAQVAGKPPGG